MFAFSTTSKRRVKPLQKAKSYRNPICVAREWQTALEERTYSCAADLARTLSISRARVTQMLRLLRLHPEVLEAIAALGDPLPSRLVTERMLRPIVDLPAQAQLVWVERCLS
jgi:hypothetical protein